MHLARAVCLIRPQLKERRAAFESGLKAAGYSIVEHLDKPNRDDIAVVWNRHGLNGDVADQFDCAGARTLVCENGYLGNYWAGDMWLAMAIGHHSGAGLWPRLGGWRWDELGIELAPWKTGGTETLILAQRGIGEPMISSPMSWAENTKRKLGVGRIRPHPGLATPSVSLEDDLKNVKQVVTWNSSAALHALLLGVPVWYEFPQWIGAMACRPLSEFGGEPKRDDDARLNMFRQLAWAQWRLREIADGSAFKMLLN